jgi:hypothetical protein
MKFLEWIKSLFTEQSYQDSIERYVVSKNPTSAAEVEHWIREYAQRTHNGGWAL